MITTTLNYMGAAGHNLFPDVEDERWSKSFGEDPTVAGKFPSFSATDIKKINADLNKTQNGISKAGSSCDVNGGEITNSLRIITDGTKLFVSAEVRASMRPLKYVVVIEFEVKEAVGPLASHVEFKRALCRCPAGQRLCHHSLSVLLTLAALSKLDIKQLPKDWGSVTAKDGHKLSLKTKIRDMPTTWTETVKTVRSEIETKKRRVDVRYDNKIGHVMGVVPADQQPDKLSVEPQAASSLTAFLEGSPFAAFAAFDF
jgi:hypothetical protein